MATDKQTYRNRVKERRTALDPELRRIMDANIREAVLKSEEWKRARIVLTYLSVGDEVGTRMLIKAGLEAHKMVAIPRVVGPQQMEWFALQSMDELTTRGVLEKSTFGIEEPRENEARRVPQVALTSNALLGLVLALVPGLVFDARGYRLGYGGGYYDAFLKDFTGTSFGLCRRAFYLTELPFLDEHDVPVNRVIVG